MKKTFTLVLLLLFDLAICEAQVNGYAKVTGRSGATLTVSNVNETYGTFTAGQRLILMQMQDNVIGGNTNNSASFGNLGSILSAGLYEIIQISSVNRSSGTLTSITLSTTPANTFNFNANTSVQVISFPTLGSPDYTTTANITAVPWDGNVGGVVAFNVNGALTLNHNITANYAGFRGGAANGGGTANCGDATRYRNSEADEYANKGEGIYKVTSTSYAAGRGKILNGGGGGNAHNAGGGGGGNFTAGGTGGPGWVCDPGYGGLGGIALQSYITGSRVFMGGGGGAGEVNNGNPSRGGNGGGIVILQATTVRTTGSGDTIRISANGETGIGSTDDGAGGAGAAGSIILMVNSWSVVGTKPVAVMANGGNGGDVAHNDQHGGGGGGAQGIIINMFASTGPNVGAQAQNGQGGRNNTGGARAGSASGSNNAGIVGMGVLPSRLIYFTGLLKDGETALNWKTADELVVDHYEIQRSTDGISFAGVGTVAALNNSTSVYSFTDRQPATGTVWYYRLKTVDRNGSYSYSNVIIIRKAVSTQAGISAYPNPARSSASLFVQSNEAGTAAVSIMNLQGLVLADKRYQVQEGNNTLLLPPLDNLTNGVYAVRVVINNTAYITHLVIQK